MNITKKKDYNGHKADDVDDCDEDKLRQCHHMTLPCPGRQSERYGI